MSSRKKRVQAKKRTKKRIRVPKIVMREPVALSLETEEPVLSVGPHLEPPSASLSLPAEDVIDLAFHGGDAEPLAACIEGGSVSRRKALADWFRKNFRGNTTATKEVRNRRILNLYKEGWTAEQIAEKFGLTPRMIWFLLEDYNDGTITITPPTAQSIK
jgi:hypothetical protein